MVEAIAHHEKAVQLDPDYAWPHYDLGNILRVRGHLREAYGQYLEVIRLDPKNREVQNPLRIVLVLDGRGKEALALWKKATDSDPAVYANWSGYAELCLFLGQEDEYRRARQNLLAKFSASSNSNILERTSRACLLLPTTEDELRQVRRPPPEQPLQATLAGGAHEAPRIAAPAAKTGSAKLSDLGCVDAASSECRDCR